MENVILFRWYKTISLLLLFNLVVIVCYCLLQEQIILSKDISQCFRKSDPRNELIRLRDDFVSTLNTLAGLVSTNLIPHKRLSINALLTIDVHNRDILNNMIDNNIIRKDDFEWTR